MKVKAKNLNEYPWVGQNVGIEWEKSQKVSIDPYLDQNFVYFFQVVACQLGICYSFLIWN